MINEKYVGSVYDFIQMDLIIRTKNQENLMNFSFGFKEISASVYRLDKLKSLFPKPEQNSMIKTKNSQSLSPLALFFSNYSIEAQIKVFFNVFLLKSHLFFF